MKEEVPIDKTSLIPGFKTALDPNIVTTVMIGVTIGMLMASLTPEAWILGMVLAIAIIAELRVSRY